MADKLPWFPFYADDWLSHDKLRSCSSAARGLWIDMLCLMHKNDRRGYLQLSGKSVTPEQLARMTGRSPDETSQQLAELIAADVASVAEHGIIFSRRMVKDERIRQVRSAAGAKGGAKTGVYLSKISSKRPAKAKQPPQQTSGSGSDSGSDSSSGKRKKGGAGEEGEGFAEFYAKYPRHEGRAEAAVAWNKIRPDAALRAEMDAGLDRYIASTQWQKDGGRYIPHPATWLNNHRWEGRPPPAAANGAHLFAGLQDFVNRGAEGPDR